MKRTWLLFLPLFVPVTGCAVVAVAAAAGAIGLVQYDRNKAHRDFEVPFEEAYQASVAVAADLGYPDVVVKLHTPTEGEFASGEDLWVRVEDHPDGFICVAVRVGNFDTEDHRRRSGLFLNEVAKQLGEDPHETSGSE